MRLKSAKRSARVELQRAARNIRDMIETLHAWKPNSDGVHALRPTLHNETRKQTTRKI